LRTLAFVSPAALLLLLALAPLTAAAPASAATLDATSFGVYPHDGIHFQADRSDVPLGIYRTGNCDACDEEWRTYFLFDLSGPGLPTNVTEARLRLDALRYQSPDPSETFVLYDVSTSPASLVTTGKPQSENLAIWNDLGSGTSYGSRDFSPADNGLTVDILLNADALTAINAAILAGDSLAIGGAITTCMTCTTIGQGLADEFLFRADTTAEYVAATKQLLLVPEPSPGPLVAGVLLVLAGGARRIRA
jgi:hypothetical protein